MSISVSQVLYKRQGVCEFKEPKTAHSRRRVSMTPNLAEYLREYRLECEAIYRELDKQLTLDDLVFAGIEGNPLDLSVLSHEFHKITKRAGLENVRFHDMRHTAASLMLQQCILSPKVISEILGHASVAFTMDTYAHIIKGMQEEAMKLYNDVLPSGLKRNNAKLTLTF